MLVKFSPIPKFTFLSDYMQEPCLSHPLPHRCIVSKKELTLCYCPHPHPETQGTFS